MDYLCKYCGSVIPHDIVEHALHLKAEPRYCCNNCARYYQRSHMSRAEYEASLFRTCEWCGKEFKAVRTSQRFCSPGCNSEYNNNKGLTKSEVDARRASRRKAAAEVAEARKSRDSADLEEAKEFEFVLALDASDRFAVVSKWPEDKRKRLRAAYCAIYGVRSVVTPSARSADDAEGADDDLSREADEVASSDGPDVPDEDNGRYE